MHSAFYIKAKHKLCLCYITPYMLIMWKYTVIGHHRATVALRGLNILLPFCWHLSLAFYSITCTCCPVPCSSYSVINPQDREPLCSSPCLLHVAKKERSIGQYYCCWDKAYMCFSIHRIRSFSHFKQRGTNVMILFTWFYITRKQKYELDATTCTIYVWITVLTSMERRVDSRPWVADTMKQGPCHVPTSPDMSALQWSPFLRVMASCSTMCTRIFRLVSVVLLY